MESSCDVRSLTDLCMERLWTLMTAVALDHSNLTALQQFQTRSANVESSSEIVHPSPVGASNESKRHPLIEYSCAMRAYLGKQRSDLGDKLLRGIANSLMLNDDVAEALFGNECGLFDLRRVTLRYSGEVSNRLFHILVESKVLQSLDCSFFTMPGAAVFTDALQSSLQTLTELNLRGTKGRLVSSLFASLKSLRFLDVSCSSFDDACLESLSQSGAPISSLNLSLCQLSSLQPLAGLRSTLARLLVREKPKQTSLLPLRALDKLQSLDISFLNVAAKFREHDYEFGQINALLKVGQRSATSRENSNNFDMQSLQARVESIGLNDDEATLWPRLKLLNVCGWANLQVDVLESFLATHPHLQTLLIANRAKISNEEKEQQLRNLANRYPQLFLSTNLLRFSETLQSSANCSGRVYRLLQFLLSMIGNGVCKLDGVSIRRLSEQLANVMRIHFHNSKVRCIVYKTRLEESLQSK